MYRILITGSRSWTNRDLIARQLRDTILANKLERDEVVVIHGACPKGADNMADEICISWGATTEKYPADWDRYGRSAGHVRNKQMVDLGADVCLAFIRDNSPGATSTVRYCNQADIPVIIHRE